MNWMHAGPAMSASFLASLVEAVEVLLTSSLFGDPYPKVYP